MEDSKHNYGIDVLRIISMMMVLALHVLGQGGVYPYAGIDTLLRDKPLNYPIAWLLETAAFGAVDIFALISGYVGCKSKKLRTGKYLNLMAMVCFWGLLIVTAIDKFPVVFDWLNQLFAQIFPDMNMAYEEVTITSETYLAAALPVSYYQYWYFNAYTLLFFATPLLNFVLNKCSRAQLYRIDLSIIVLLSLIPTLCNSDLFVTIYGYSGLWLMALYLLGGTIRLYPPNPAGLLRKIGYLAGYLLCTLAAWGYFVLINGQLGEHPELETILNTTIQYSSPLILFASLFLLLFAIQLHPRNKVVCKTLSIIGSATFAVYIIHVQPVFFIYYLLWRFRSLAYLDTGPMVLGVLAAVLILFVICIALELIRSLLFKVLWIDRLLLWIGDKLDLLVDFIVGEHPKPNDPPAPEPEIAASKEN